MIYRDLEVFLATAELLHFGRAAQKCNLSPSALTRAIQRLEEDIGERLFIRDNRSVRLSSTGEKFKTYARNGLQQWQEFRASIDEGAGFRGTLSIYASITAVYSLLPRLLEAYRDAYPEIRIELRTGVAEQAVDQVVAGEIDLAVAALPESRAQRLEFMPLIVTPLVFIAPLREGMVVTSTNRGRLDLGRTPLVVPRAGLSRVRLDKWLKGHRIVPNISLEVSGNEAIIAMVRLGCGVGVVPELVLERSPFRGEVTILKQAPVLKPYGVGLCTTKRNLARPCVRAIWEMAGSASSNPETGNGSGK